MARLITEALLSLVRVDWLMSRRGGIVELHQVVKNRTLSLTRRSIATPEQICRAVDVACVLYFKRVLCLQRSSATTLLLRRYGFPASLVIGARITPFKSHAWVELEGLILNDKAYMHQLYQELDRC
jgi:hypothetical protein